MTGRAYLPNFNDPRCQSRVKRALGFACGVMSETKSHPWSTRYIDKYFGISSNPLSKYLRDKLLICTDDFYRFGASGQQGICKKYRLNKEGVRFLREQITITNTQLYPIVVEVIKTDHNSELITGQFDYLDKSHRLWHPLQRYRRQHRTGILNEYGYIHHYDIKTCAPTLIHQYAQQIPLVIDQKGRWLQGPMDLYLFALRRYLRAKEQVREEIAREMELPIAAVKEIITALFAGAVISRRRDSDIYQILGGDLPRIQWLKLNPYIQELVSDIKTCWEYIKPTLQVRTKKTSKGSVRRLPINSRQKWRLYFELERQVVESIRTYLDQRSIRYFLIHDGFSCDTQIDQQDLRDYVRNQCGFDLEFERSTALI